MTQAIGQGVGLDRASVEAHARHRGEPDWLLAVRLAAWQRYEALPVPTTRDEHWKRTDLSTLDLERLAAPGGSEDQPAAGGLVEHLNRGDEQAGRLVLRNGEVVERVLRPELARRGVLLLSLAEAVRDHPDLARRYLTVEGASAIGDKFDALAAALWSDGAFVYLPRGVELEQPLQLIRWIDAPGAALSQSVVVVEQAASASLVESVASPAELPESLACATVECVLEAAARLTYIHLQERDEQSWNLSHLRSRQARDSAMTWLLVSLGGRLGRTALDCHLLGQGAEADLLGLAFGEASQHFDLQSLQDHVGSDTRSDLVFKAALRDHASSTFTGMIRVGQNALRTASNQENRNLLLSGEARADSDPKLEILNSDVTRCGHGATVGPVDEEMIFYLMTRGLTRVEAERLVVEGFFDPLLARIPLESLRQRLWASIERDLNR